MTAVRGLRITTPARTILDLASGTTTDRLEQLLLELARTDRRALRQVGELFDRYPRVPGRRRLATAAGRLPGEASLLGSPLEVLGVQELRRLGAPPPRLQHTVRDRAGAAVKRVDTAWPSLWAIAEFDGAAYHDPSAVRGEDESCRARLRALGWRVEVFRRADLGGPRLRAFASQLRALAADRVA